MNTIKVKKETYIKFINLKLLEYELYFNERLLKQINKEYSSILNTLIFRKSKKQIKDYILTNLWNKEKYIILKKFKYSYPNSLKNEISICNDSENLSIEIDMYLTDFIHYKNISSEHLVNLLKESNKKVLKKLKELD